MDRRRMLIALITVAVVALAALPAAVVFGSGWLSIGHPSALPGEPVSEAGSLELWAAVTIFYVAWMAGLMVLVIWLYDRVGYHYAVHERKVREPRRRRRRRAAGLGYLAARERADAGAPPEGPPRRPPAERGGSA